MSCDHCVLGSSKNSSVSLREDFGCHAVFKKAMSGLGVGRAYECPCVRVSASALAGFAHVWPSVVSGSDFNFLMNLLALCICTLLSPLPSYPSACFDDVERSKELRFLTCLSVVVLLLWRHSRHTHTHTQSRSMHLLSSLLSIEMSASATLAVSPKGCAMYARRNGSCHSLLEVVLLVFLW